MNDNNPALDILFYAIIGTLLYYTFRLVFSARETFSTASPRGGGCRGGLEAKINKPKSVFQNLGAKEKACIAVGICDPVEHFGVVVNAETRNEWKIKLIENAEKIFNSAVPKTQPMTALKKHLVKSKSKSKKK